MTCVKLCSDWVLTIKIRVKRIFTRLQLWAHKLFVGHVHGGWKNASHSPHLQTTYYRTNWTKTGLLDYDPILCSWWHNDMETAVCTAVPLWRESTSDWWINLTKASDAEIWYFVCCWLEKLLNKHLSKQWYRMPWCWYDDNTQFWYGVFTIYIYIFLFKYLFFINVKIAVVEEAWKGVV